MVDGSRYLIDVTEDSLFNALMLDDLAQDATVTTANYEHFLGIGVRIHGQVRDHLLVCKLITLGALDDVVQDQHPAVVGGLEDEHILVLALLMVKDLLDLEGHGLACMVVDGQDKAGPRSL